MATKQVREVLPVEHLTGTVQGTRFLVKLDELKIGDKWDPATLPVLERDGIGKTTIADGVTLFQFRDTAKSTVEFTAVEGMLEITAFFAEASIA